MPNNKFVEELNTILPDTLEEFDKALQTEWPSYL